MLKNHAWVKEPFKVPGRPIGFNAILYEKLPDKISFSTLKCIFKKLSLAEFWHINKKNIQNYLKRFVEIFPPSPIAYICVA